MTQTTIEDPDLYDRKRVNSDGRLWLGAEWAGKDVELVLKEVEGSGGDE